ncbi:MAG TPA: HAD-IA family hydrolase [Chloroflexia bacterium]|nr:HAD-IA family hydrolase [Chloroflexia bacterium]
MAPTLRAVFFDAGLTLIQSEMPLAERCAEAAQRCSISVTSLQIEAALPAAMDHMLQSHRDDPNIWSSDAKVENLWLEYYISIFREVGAAPQAPDLAREIYAQYNRPGAWTLYPDVLPTLEHLSSQGYIIGVISDWSSNLPATILLPLGIGQYVSFMVVSTVQREAKPGWGLYREALARAGVQPQEAVHIGDNYVNDVLGARAAGIRGILLDREGVHTTRLDCPRITTLKELPNLLKRLLT